MLVHGQTQGKVHDAATRLLRLTGNSLLHAAQRARLDWIAPRAVDSAGRVADCLQLRLVFVPGGGMIHRTTLVDATIGGDPAWQGVSTLLQQYTKSSMIVPAVVVELYARLS